MAELSLERLVSEIMEIIYFLSKILYLIRYLGSCEHLDRINQFYTKFHTIKGIKNSQQKINSNQVYKRKYIHFLILKKKAEHCCSAFVIR